jgi:hypothetical protein
MRRQAPCHEPALFVDISAATALKQVIRHVDSEPAHAPAAKSDPEGTGKSDEESAPAPAGKNSFENPWSEETFVHALERGKKYKEDLERCVRDTWHLKTGHFLAAYHKLERLETIRAMKANPESAENTEPCPKTPALHAELEKTAKARLEELSPKIQELRTLVESQNKECRDPNSSVHFSDLENAIRTATGKPLLPDDVEFIAKHWVPFVNRVDDEMQSKYSLKDGLTIPAVHTFLMMDQLEAVRADIKLGKIS